MGFPREMAMSQAPLSPFSLEEPTLLDTITMMMHQCFDISSYNNDDVENNVHCTCGFLHTCITRTTDIVVTLQC